MYSVPEEIPIVFHIGSNYDYHFIIKELAQKFEGQCTCSGENTEKYIPFFVTIEKENTRIDRKKKPQKPYLTYHNLLIVQDLWQAYYQDNLPEDIHAE